MGGSVGMSRGKSSATVPGDWAVQPRAAVVESGTATKQRRAIVRFALWAVVVTAAFAGPLWVLVRFAARSDLFSHILLIPFVSAYLIWKRPSSDPLPPATRSGLALVPAALSLLLLLVYWLVLRPRGALPATDYLSLMTTAYLGLLLAGALAFFGWELVKTLSFPIAFLVFMIPWPNAVIDAVETGLQYASAEAASGFLTLSGTPFLQDGRVFQLPGITIQVAQECSGVRSSLVLFITSLLAAQLLLRARWRRWVLVLAVIPLGILRNGFRILTIAMLCVHVDPGMIDSPIHHRGGPLFFALSLIPFFLLLLWLRKAERRLQGNAATPRPHSL